MTKSRFWADWSTREFAQLDPARTVAVLPLGATEQHGPHLPLAVDQVLVDGIVAAALPRLPENVPVLFLPTQQVGYSPEHARFDGTLSLSAPVAIATWTELGEGVARAGLKKLLLFNSHGGQVGLMDIVARELRSRCKLIVYSCSWWNLPLGEEVQGLFSAQEHRFGIHGGDIETSMMLALRPELVDLSQALHDGPARFKPYDRYPRPTDGVPPSGALSLTEGSSAEVGRWLLADAVEGIEKAVRQEFSIG